MRIVRRSEWGFTGWSATPYHVNERADRIEFFVHYHGGGSVVGQTGVSVPRGIHKYHRSLGWKGIGYGHVIDANGTIYEGRGFDLVGSHCSGHNRTGYSVQIHIGGDDRPTLAQLEAARWLYEEARRRSGRYLIKRGHRDGFATACPGDRLYAWVRAGFPVSSTYGSGGGIDTTGTGGTATGGTTFTPQEDIMASIEDLEKVVREQVDRATRNVVNGVERRLLVEYRTEQHRSIVGLLEQAARGDDPDEVAKAVAAELRDDLGDLAAAVSAAGSGATAEQIVDEFVRRFTNPTQEA